MRKKLKKVNRIKPDYQYNSETLSKFINYVMKDGKKNVARTVMYGAMEWCKYTQGQRAMFGKSFKYINYHEFTELPGISKTPTWVINGKWYENAQSFDKLSGLTGCKI